MRFTKMHGCGNDYVFVDGWRDRLPTEPAEVVPAMSDRHTGIGSDGVIVIGPSAVADARMEMWNADGSRSEMCGNGLRCAVRLAWDHGHLAGPEVAVETGAGILQAACRIDRAGRVAAVSVAMGEPRLDPSRVPVDHPGPPGLLRTPLDLDSERLEVICVGMGNPHAVCFVAEANDVAIEAIGRRIEHHPRFPSRTNVEFVTRRDDEHGLPVLRQRTWERGAGETEACGTGACAVTVAAILAGRIPAGNCTVRLNGGDLATHWSGRGGVTMTGPTETVFEGDWPDEGQP